MAISRLAAYSVACMVIIGTLGGNPALALANEYCVTHEQLIASGMTDQVVGGGSAVPAYQSTMWTTIPNAIWIWRTYHVEDPVHGESVTFTRNIAIDGTVASSTLVIAGDDYFKVYINGLGIASEFGEGNFLTPHTYALDPLLFRSGNNELRIEATNAKYFYSEGATVHSNPAGIAYSMSLTSWICTQNGGRGPLLNPDVATVRVSGLTSVSEQQDYTTPATVRSASSLARTPPQLFGGGGYEAQESTDYGAQTDTASSTSVAESNDTRDINIVSDAPAAGDGSNVLPKIFNYALIVLALILLYLVVRIIVHVRARSRANIVV